MDLKITVEEVSGNSEGDDRNYEYFPVGMRVLAVDDNPICLRLLDSLLRKCHYNVTTTSQARMALKMLRENRDRFDLIISDVHMPDMDGFKLLELVEFEMDLPVIMLSENSDSKLVMKGVNHGACDYLVKPVRIEELRNIWQHVIRRKKFESKKHDKSAYEDEAFKGKGEACQGPQRKGNTAKSGKINKKRMDEDEGEDNGQEHEDPATQKKTRVFWSNELHRKFVEAVDQLGIKKAFPKRILHLMNVEGLTRNNVASHLQKYKLCLNRTSRTSSVATQQANMVAALGEKGAAHMRMSTLDGLGDFRTLNGSGRQLNPAFSAYTQGGMLGKLISPAGITLCNLASSTLVQPTHAQILNSSINTLGKLDPARFQVNQTASVFQGGPSSFELDHLQQNKCATRFGDFNPMDDMIIFGAAGSFTENSNNILSGMPNNSVVLQGNSQQVVAGGGFVDQSSVSLASFPSESFDWDFGGSSGILDHDRINENWQSAVVFSKFPSNALSNDSFSQGQLALSIMRDSNSSAGSNLQNIPLGFSSTATTSASLEDSRGEMQCHEGLVGGCVQNLSQAPGKRWEVPKQNYFHNSTLNPQASTCVITALSQSMGQNGIDDQMMDMCSNGQSSEGKSSFFKPSDIENPTTVLSGTRSSEDYMLEQIKPQDGFVPNSYDSLDDLLSTIKPEQNRRMFDGDIGFDTCHLGHAYGAAAASNPYR